MKFTRNVSNKKCVPKIILLYEIFFRKIQIIFDKKIDFESQKLAIFVSRIQNFGKRYENAFRAIFYQWPKLCMGFDVEPDIQILKVI